MIIVINLRALKFNDLNNTTFLWLNLTADYGDQITPKLGPMQIGGGVGLVVWS